jgi:hypothetical protein
VGVVVVGVVVVGVVVVGVVVVGVVVVGVALFVVLLPVFVLVAIFAAVAFSVFVGEMLWVMGSTRDGGPSWHPVNKPQIVIVSSSSGAAKFM